jgi:hypothetical protein
MKSSFLSRTSASRLLVLALVSCGLPGCGSGDETSGYKLVPVNGTVTMGGKPVEGALVTFVPDEENNPSTPGGDSTGPEGNYKAMFRGRSGLAPGKYKVLISRTSLPRAKSAGAEEDPYMTQLANQAAGANEAVTPIEGEFEGEVGSGSTTLDFVVQEKAAPPAAKTKK